MTSATQPTFMPRVRRDVTFDEVPDIVENLPSVDWSFEVTAWPRGVLSASSRQVSEERMDQAIVAAKKGNSNDLTDR